MFNLFDVSTVVSQILYCHLPAHLVLVNLQTCVHLGDRYLLRLPRQPNLLPLPLLLPIGGHPSFPGLTRSHLPCPQTLGQIQAPTVLRHHCQRLEHLHLEEKPQFLRSWYLLFITSRYQTTGKRTHSDKYYIYGRV